MKKIYVPLFLTAAMAGCGGGAQSVMTHQPGSTATPVTNRSATSVQVSSPADNSTVNNSVAYAATATSSCASGIAKMAVYTNGNSPAYQTNGNKLNTTLNFTQGTYATKVQAWDNCGNSAQTPVNITVKNSLPYPSPATPAGSKTFSSLQADKGWKGYALLPTSYNICPSCISTGPQTTWWSQTGVNSPSLSGNATQFDIGGQTQFSDVLWNNHLIGDFSSHGLMDWDKSLANSVHNFIYDVYFYSSNIPASQALEFDINQFVNGQSYIWGHECRIAGGGQWDIWDNQGMKWHPTGVPCKPLNNAWNHLILQAQRTSDGHLLFKSITLNGQTANLNYYEWPTSTGWHGITINYQMDGDRSQQGYSVFLDNLNFTYW